MVDCQGQLTKQSNWIEEENLKQHMIKRHDLGQVEHGAELELLRTENVLGQTDPPPRERVQRCTHPHTEA